MSCQETYVRAPVAEDADGHRLVPDAQRLDLGAVGPRHRQDSHGEAVHVQEHERSRRRRVGVALHQQTARDDKHADGAAGTGEHDGPSPPDPVDVEEGRPGEDCVLGESDGGEDEGHLKAEAEVVLENVGEIVAEDVDARPSGRHCQFCSHTSTLRNH